MFQTEPILYIQSFQNTILTFIMKMLSELGSSSLLTILLLAVMFGINYRKGFLLVQVAIWTIIMTELLKNIFALPRPYHVDSRVNLLTGEMHPHVNFYARGAQSFFSPLPDYVTNYYKNVKDLSFGFPSGHSSGAVSIWGSMALLFKKRIMCAIALFFIILVPFSRLYLGVHFIAAILAGFVTGGFVLLLFYLVIFKENNLNNYLNFKKFMLDYDISNLIVYGYLLIVPILMLFIPKITPSIPGRLLGINIGFLFVGLKGFPCDDAMPVQRIYRIILVGILYKLINLIGSQLIEFLAVHRSVFIEFVLGTTVLFLTVWGATELLVKLKLYSRK